VVFVQLSGPDQDGRYSLGAGRDYLVAAVKRARAVIAEVSPAVPWTYGGPYLTGADLAAIVPARYHPAELPAPGPSAVADAIAANVAGLIQDGATLQFGVGSMTEAVLAELGLTASGFLSAGPRSAVIPRPWAWVPCPPSPRF